MAKPIVLVGMMGAGKTTIGKRLAARLATEFVDTDDLVVAQAGKSVRDIFLQDGEPEFRRLESLAVRDALSRQGVVAAAGGSVLSADNRSLMDQHARCVVWLDADPATLAKRTMKGGHRPLLDTNPTQQLTAMDAQRRAIYESLADVRVDTAHKPIDAVVEEILSALQGAHAS